MAELFQDQNIIAFPQTLAPAKRFPIIGNRIFGTLKEAQAYVDEIVRGTAVPGIILSVIADGDNNGAYWVSKAAGYDGAEKGVLLKINWSGSSNPVVGMLNDLTDVSISNPSNGQFLIYDSSLGVWTNKAFSIALASSSVRGGVKVGFSAKYQTGSYYSIPVELDSEKAFVKMTKAMVATALGYTPMNQADFTGDNIVQKLGYTPFDAAAFTKANIKSKLGISDWALASSKPSYSWSEIGSKPTTLAGYGITDAVRYENEIDPTTTGVPAVMGYRSSAGWKSGGPVMLWGKTGYYTRLNVSMEKSDSPRMYISNVYANTEYDWALFLTDKSIGEHAIAIESDGNNLLVGDKQAKTGYVFGQNGWKAVGPAMTFPQGNYKGLLNMAMYNPATADNGVSAYLGVVYAGNQGKWSLILTEHNIGNYAALKATTLEGYGITDAYTITQIETRFNNTALYGSHIDITNNDAARHIGYGYATGGWHGSGPAMSFGVAAYNLRMQLAIEASDTPRIMVSQVYNGTAYGWAELLTKEGLQDRYLTTAGYKCYDQVVLHKVNGGDTFVNYGGATNESNSLQLYYGTSFVVSLKGQSVMTMANNGYARFYKDLRVDGTLISNTIYGDAPSGANYYRYRMIMLSNGLYIQAATYDGMSNDGNITLSGFGGVAANDISLRAKTIQLQSQGIRFYVADGATEAWRILDDGRTYAYKDFLLTGAVLRIYQSGSDAMVYARNTDTNSHISFGVAAGGYNRGIYDNGVGAWWILRGDDTNTYIGGAPGSAMMPVLNSAQNIGTNNYRWASLYTKTADVKDSIKIGDAVISWDADAGMLKVSKGIYSTGAITAGGKGNSNLGGPVMIDLPAIMGKSSMTDAQAAAVGLTDAVIANLVAGKYTKIVCNNNGTDEVWNYSGRKGTSLTHLFFTKGDVFDYLEAITMYRGSSGTWEIRYNEI